MRFPTWFANIGHSLLDTFILERDRWILWLPVFFCAGIALYFALPYEPPLTYGVAVWCGLIPVFYVVRRSVWLLGAVACLCAISLGFVVVQARAAWVAAPVLEREIGPIMIEGVVDSIEARAQGGSRAILSNISLGASDIAPPHRVRVRLNKDSAHVRPGDRIAVKVVLSPPTAPVMPDGFDFARQAWFQELGAVGYALSAAQIVAGPESRDMLDALSLALATIRHDMTARIMTAIPNEAGAVAAALITGESGAIPEDLMQAYRDSGLAHLLSISGLHMALVAGLAFFVIRGGLALIPVIALSYPIKKWAAALALVATFGYMLLSGAPVPSQRAFLMTSVMLLAILVDRSALSLRVIAWAALGVLTFHPEALIGASFQMSFAAVLALIAAYEAITPKLLKWQAGRDYHPVFRALHGAYWYLAGILFSTLIAGSATAIYGIYHFNRYAVWSMAANLIAVPLTGFWVMPCALIAVLLMPLGLDQPVLAVMGWGVEVINQIARHVAAWPMAAISVPVLSSGALVVFTLGGLWLCLWRQRWRVWGIVPMAGALVSIFFYRPPDILIEGEAKIMAVRDLSGLMMVSSLKAGDLARETWLERAAQDQSPAIWPHYGQSADKSLACDALGCVYRARNYVTAFIFDPLALAEDCRSADIIVAIMPIKRLSQSCPRPHLVIDRSDLKQNGAHAVWLSLSGIRVDTVESQRGIRPWTKGYKEVDKEQEDP